MLPEQELAVISLLASYAEAFDTPIDYLDDLDDEKEADSVTSTLNDKISAYFPELSKEQLNDFFINAFDLYNSHIGGYGAPLPEIAPEHKALIEQGYNEYQRRKAETIKRLNDGNFLGKISCFLLGYELINIYADILTKV